MNSEITGCCPNCRAPCAGDFKKFVELQYSGLVIYLHTKRDEQRHITTTDCDYTYIVQNTTNKQLAKPEYIRELCRYNTKCDQCKTIIRRVRSLLDELDSIKENEVIRLCQCWKQPSKSTTCPRCDYILKRFIASHQYKLKERQNRFNIWLCRVRHLLQAIIDGKSVCQHGVYKDKEFEQLLRILKEPLANRNLDVDQFPSLQPEKIASLQSITENKQLVEDILANIRKTEKISSWEESIPSDICVCPPPSETCICRSFRERSLGRKSSGLDTTVFQPKGYFQSTDGSEKILDSKEPISLKDEPDVKDRKLKTRQTLPSTTSAKVAKEAIPSLKDAFKDIRGKKQESPKTDKEKIKKQAPKEDIRQKSSKEKRGISKERRDLSKERKDLLKARRDLSKDKKQRHLNEPKSDISKEKYKKQETKLLSPKLYKDKTKKHVPKEHVREKSPKDLKDVAKDKIRVKSPKDLKDVAKDKIREKSPKDIKDKIREKSPKNLKDVAKDKTRGESPKDLKDVAKDKTREKSPKDLKDVAKDMMKKIMQKEDTKKQRPLIELKQDKLKEKAKKQEIKEEVKQKSLKQLKPDTPKSHESAESLKEVKKSPKQKKKQKKDEPPEKEISESAIRKAWQNKLSGKDLEDLELNKLKQKIRKRPPSQAAESKLSRDQLDFILGLVMENKLNTDKYEVAYIKKESKKMEKERLKSKRTRKKKIMGQPKAPEEVSVSAVVECDDSPDRWPRRMIKGNDMVPFVPYKEEAPKEVEAEFFKTIIEFPESPVYDGSDDENNLIPMYRKVEFKGITRYRLSDKTFIEKGWTKLPQKKILRKMNIYKMRPANPEYDWFERHKNDRVLYYDSANKHILADIDINGLGHWYYPNGAVALDCYETHESNLRGKRYVVYSSGEEIINGKIMPRTILGVFDFLGNGIVYDHNGKTRLKYNQSEGVIIDPKLGPPSKWKWHSLNDPPVLHEVLVDPVLKQPDPDIRYLIEEYGLETKNNRNNSDNLNMLAIEFDQYVKEKQYKMTQKFEPYQIRVKAVKINENFALRIVDQANILLFFRDLKNKTSFKLNLGLLLISDEIVDTEIADIDDIATPYDRIPASSESIENMLNLLKRRPPRMSGRRRT